MANRFSGRRTDKEWGSIPGFRAFMTSNNTIAIASFPATVALTVMRMLGQYTIIPSSAPTAADAECVTVGIGVISSDAFGVGGAGLPDPAGEPGYPWLYWASHPFDFTDASLDSGSAGATLRADFDIRSMRKMKPNQSLAFVVQNVSIAGAPPLVINAGLTRVLFGR